MNRNTTIRFGAFFLLVLALLVLALLVLALLVLALLVYATQWQYLKTSDGDSFRVNRWTSETQFQHGSAWLRMENIPR